MVSLLPDITVPEEIIPLLDFMAHEESLGIKSMNNESLYIMATITYVKAQWDIASFHPLFSMPC